jgi:F-type H+-transporting ATPase subunit b
MRLAPSTTRRTLGRAFALHALALAATATPALAQHEEGAAAAPSLMSPNPGLIIWTILIFLALFFILRRFAFPPIIAAVAAREKALEEAIEGARRDRDEAARLLAEQRQQIEAARTEAQRFIADGRAAGDRIRADMLEQTRQQQQELLDRARRDIEGERDRAIGELRREAVDLAIAGAGKVIEKNLDEQSNRRLVESFLASIPPGKVRS